MAVSELLPLIAIPMGDPNGIGPEIVVKALADPAVYSFCRPVVVGDAFCLARALGVCGIELLIHTVPRPEQGVYRPGFLNLIDLAHDNLADLAIGTVQALAGQCAMTYIREAVALAAAGQVDALATTPINKESLRAADVPHIGHTEILADLTGTHDPLTVFETNGLRVFFLTRLSTRRRN